MNSSIPPIADPTLIYPPSNPKDPVGAILLNVLPSLLFIHGVGYFYIGQWQKGLAALIGSLGAWGFFAAVTVLTCGLGAVCVFPLWIGLVIFTAIDVQKQAMLLQRGIAIRQWTFLDTAA